MPLRAAASAVTCAANGVDLREPLNPAPPADSHAITFTSPSVRDTIVLLKDVLICAWPTTMFFLTFRRPRAGRFGAGIYFFVAFFLPATCMRRGPLRVPALGLVRWPRTGMPRRGRRPRQQPISRQRLMFFQRSARGAPPPVSFSAVAPRNLTAPVSVEAR